MDDPVAAERENLAYELALLGRMRANLAERPTDDITYRACTEAMNKRFARLEELEPGGHRDEPLHI